MPHSKAFIDHGTAKATLTEGVDEAQAQLTEAAKLGIDVETLATRLAGRRFETI